MRAFQSLKGQPPGVYLMFSTEFWERFSYYGFMGILVFFMIDEPSGGGLGWSRGDALLLFGIITGTMWIAPIVGGWVADNLIGARRAVAAGCAGLAVGNLLLAAAGYIAASQAAADNASPAALAMFYLGLLALIVGAGLFKSNASALLGELFAPGDSRRDAGFTLFYMGINLGALIAPLGAGTLGELAGWSYGFLISGIGMLVGLAIFARLSPRYFNPNWVRKSKTSTGGRSALRDPGVRLILLMAAFAVVFMAGHMQYGGLLNLYAATTVDREIFGWSVPATWFLTVNPLLVILLGPLVASFWSQSLRSSARESFATKMTLGLCFMAAAFGMLSVVEALRGEALAPPWVMLLFYLLLTTGELCVLPAGLAEISRRAPPHAVGVLMGVWILTMGIGSVLAGWLGSLTETNSQGFIFGALATAGIAAAALLLLLEPRLRNWSSGTQRGTRPVGVET